jgi:hypothetical protein
LTNSLKYEKIKCMNELIIKSTDTQIDKIDQRLSVLKRLGGIISGLQKGIQLTLNNLPLAYIDPQTILEEIASDPANSNVTDETIALSTTPIDYLDGVPIVNGLPFWEKLDGEPLDYYRLFKTYRDYPIKDQNRSFEKLEIDTNTPTSYLYALSKIYHWRPRTASFDQYQLILIEKERTRQIKIMSNNHIEAADKIFKIGMDYLEGIKDAGTISSFSPKEILGWQELAVKLKRLSLGLPADKPQEEKRESEPIITNIEQQTINVTNTQQNLNIESEAHKNTCRK